MGFQTPLAPKKINAAAPDGAPPRRIKKVEIIICSFSCFGCELTFMLVSPEQVLDSTGIYSLSLQHHDCYIIELGFITAE